MKYHDFTRGRWGHNIAIWTRTAENAAHVLGTGLGIKKGDILIVTDSSKKLLYAYRVKKIAYRLDPKDLFDARLEFTVLTKAEWAIAHSEMENAK